MLASRVARHSVNMCSLYSRCPEPKRGTLAWSAPSDATRFLNKSIHRPFHGMYSYRSFPVPKHQLHLRVPLHDGQVVPVLSLPLPPHVSHKRLPWQRGHGFVDAILISPHNRERKLAGGSYKPTSARTPSPSLDNRFSAYADMCCSG